MDNDFRSAWITPVSENTWESFLSETFSDESRKYVYDKVRDYAAALSTKPTLAEIGFGQCFDFINSFKKLHDDGVLVYSGYDITEQFVNYAKRKFPEYNFSSDNFFDDGGQQVNISYTRHVFEHQNPDVGYSSFENFLKKTSGMAIVTWFVPPSAENFRWIQNDGFEHKGAYVNSYDFNKLDDIMKKHSFKCDRVLHGKCLIYIMTKDLKS